MSARPPSDLESKASANAQLAHRFLDGLHQNRPVDEIAALFGENASVELPGDVGVLPWIGKRHGRQAAADFVAETRQLTEPVEFNVDEVLASSTRAVIIGDLVTRVRSTERVIESAFAIILTISDGRISRFLMLEDSFAVSRAARTF
jgi:hypothetical protein